MDLILKAIVAFGIGAGALTAVQHFWLSSMTAQIRAAKPALPQVTAFKPTMDPGTLKLTLPTIDPVAMKRGEALGVMSAQRHIDMQVRAAQNAVPLPPRNFSGVGRR
jgi:hypothetical protein